MQAVARGGGMFAVSGSFEIFAANLKAEAKKRHPSCDGYPF